MNFWSQPSSLLLITRDASPHVVLLTSAAWCASNDVQLRSYFCFSASVAKCRLVNILEKLLSSQASAAWLGLRATPWRSAALPGPFEEVDKDSPVRERKLRDGFVTSLRSRMRTKPSFLPVRCGLTVVPEQESSTWDSSFLCFLGETELKHKFLCNDNLHR